MKCKLGEEDANDRLTFAALLSRCSSDDILSGLTATDGTRSFRCALPGLHHMAKRALFWKSENHRALCSAIVSVESARISFRRMVFDRPIC